MVSSSLDYCLQFSKENECGDVQDAELTGTLPDWLCGTLVRNGPGVYQCGKTAVRHMFDGMACLHKFVMAKGTVKYQCRVLDSETWKQCQKAQCLIATQFGTARVPDPCKSIFTRRFSHYFGSMPMDNTNVNVVPHGDRLLAFTETPSVSIVDPDSLDWKNAVDMSRIVSVRLATAHPHFDSDGSMYNLGTDFSPRQAYNIIKVPPQSKALPEPLTKAKVVAKVPSRWNFDISYNHSFGMSENYFVILEQNLTMKTMKFATMRLTGSSVEEGMVHKKNYENLLHVVRKVDGKETPVKYAADSFFCFHFVNCYEEGDFLVVDLVGYDTSDIVKNLYLDRLKDPSLMEEDPPSYRRYVLPLKVDKGSKGENLVNGNMPPSKTATATLRKDGTVHVTPEKMFVDNGVTIELPRINAGKCTKKHQFAYGTSFVFEGSELYKVDVEERRSFTWKEERFVAGKPIFVSRPGAEEEDDGVVLSTMMSKTEEKQGFLIVLDAKTFTELARASIPPGAKIPVSFHGSFVPSGTSRSTGAADETFSSVDLM